MAKRGRPIKPDAKRNDIHLRLSSEEDARLRELSEKTGLNRTELIIDAVWKVYGGINERNKVE